MINELKFNLKNKNLKIIFLCFMYIIIFYFLIFKNIFTLMELKENLEQENIKMASLDYEKSKISDALKEKRKKLEEIENIIDNNQIDSEKENFENIYALFTYLENKIEKNNIIFQNFGRSKTDGTLLHFSIELYGNENNIRNFFDEIENDKYFLDFSDSYFKIFSDENILHIKITMFTKVLNNIDKREYYGTNNNKKIFFLSPRENTSNNISVMRIGNKEFFRKNSNAIKKDDQEEDKKEKNKKSNAQKEENKWKNWF